MKDPEINCEQIVFFQHVPYPLLLYLFMSSVVSKGKRLWSNVTQNILPSLFSSVRCACMTPRRLREGRCWRLGLESTRSQRSLFLPARAQWSWATLTGSLPSLTSGKVSSWWMLRLFFLLGRFGSAQKRLFWTEAPLLRVFLSWICVCSKYKGCIWPAVLHLCNAILLNSWECCFVWPCFLLSLPAGLVRGCLKGLAGAVRGLQCHPSLPLVASCGLDRFLRVHSLEDRSLQHKVWLHKKPGFFLHSPCTSSFSFSLQISA